MDLALTLDQRAFRDEVRAFIQARLPADIRQRLRLGHPQRKQGAVAWQRILNECGWAVPHEVFFDDVKVPQENFLGEENKGWELCQLPARQRARRHCQRRPVPGAPGLRYPAEIEMALLQCPGVQDCAVFGIPDEEFGESLAAAVEAMPGVERTAVQGKQFLESRLAKYKVPRRVDFHVSLPREDSGNFFKRRLRDPFRQDAGRRI